MRIILLSLFLAIHTCDAQAAEKAIDVETVVAAPVSEVYTTWTTVDGVKSFFAPNAVIELKSNGLYEMHMNPFAPPGERGADDMRILGVQENRMLSFTWNAPPHLPEARKQRTAVIVRFTATSPNQTRVSLHHSGWGEGGEWDKAHDYFSKAWPYVLGNLKKRFESGPIDWQPHLARLKAAMAAEKK
jgi:uncharacterized protein YndB with AHSA1/START domain